MNANLAEVDLDKTVGDIYLRGKEIYGDLGAREERFDFCLKHSIVDDIIGCDSRRVQA